MENPEPARDDGTPARTRQLSRVPALWLIPIVTLLAGLWFVYDRWASQGPLITIKLSSAEGLEAGKTKIKRRSLDIGEVESIGINEARDAVLVEARIVPEFSDLLVEDAQFWVVKPQIGLSGVSGLGTLLAGYHIEFSPGASDSRRTLFDGLDSPPLTPPGTPGLHVTLNSENNFGYRAGDPIFYKGHQVGKFEDIFFNSGERMMYYNAFIEAPYHTLVTENTWFWDSSGIRAEFGTGGVSVQTGNLESILLGGVSFGLVDGEAPGERVTRRAYFEIMPSRSQIGERSYEQSVSYILLLDERIPGLIAGDPVIFRGVKVGQVVSGGEIPAGTHLLDTGSLIPARIEINPGRLGMTDDEAGRALAEEELESSLMQGMTAIVKSTNPLFGRHMVQLQLPETPGDLSLDRHDGLLVIPVKADSLDAIASQLAQLVDRLGQLPIEDIGSNLNALLAETTGTMSSIQRLAQSGDRVLASVDQEALVESLNRATTQLGELAATYSANSPANAELQLLLENLTTVLAELGPVLTNLKNQPNSLIFGGSQAEEPEPGKKEP